MTNVGAVTPHSVGSCDGAQSPAERSYPHPRLGAAAESARLQQLRSSLEELPLPEARGSTWEEQPHVQGAVAAWGHEGLEELFHVQGQEGRW